MKTATGACNRPTDADIQSFCERLTDAKNSYHGEGVCKSRFEPSKGGRAYKRIVEVHSVQGIESSRSAHCFVKLDDGTLWKPDGWKGPAKNFPRGSVFDTAVGPEAGR